MSNFKVKILDPRITRKHLDPKTPGSAGIDLCACIDEDITLFGGQQRMIKTGISLHIEHIGYAGFLFARSSMGKNGIVPGNMVGVVDSDYQGEIMVVVWNRNSAYSESRTIKPMDRIAQLVIMPVVQPQFTIVDSFDESVRADGGFGSTGV